jgi:GAF domain-containing protein
MSDIGFTWSLLLHRGGVVTDNAKTLGELIVQTARGNRSSIRVTDQERLAILRSSGERIAQAVAEARRSQAAVRETGLLLD